MRSTGLALAASAFTAVLWASLLDRSSPHPSCDVLRGSEEAFVSDGLHRRELAPPARTPQRWTTGRLTLGFRNVPAGPATLEVEAQGHVGPLIVAERGVVVGVLSPRERRGSFALNVREGGRLALELRTDAFLAGGGRRLGTRLQRVVLLHAAPRWSPPLGLIAAFVVPATCLALLARFAGFGALGAVLAAALTGLAQALLLFPHGLARSSQAWTSAVTLAAAAVLAFAASRWIERGSAGAGRFCFAALLAAAIVQGLVATSPLMVTSDAVFHANKLAAVAAGDLFPTSVTQHERPFRFPYGVSFYAMLAPLARAGLDTVTLVRWGAAASGFAAAIAAFRVLAADPRRAALAVVLLQLTPVTIDVYSYGNLSNIFGQSATVLFFAWWAGAGLGGWPAGAGLVVLAALAHFSSLVVLVALCVALAVAHRRDLVHDRTRLAALGVGLALAALYYAQFVPLMLEQLPRLAEGGGRGRAPATPWTTLVEQAGMALSRWGPPAMVLAVQDLPRPSRGRLERDLAAWWLAGAALFLIALVTPVEVRYVYALTLPLAAAAAGGVSVLWRRGWVFRAAAVLLLAAQAALAARAAVEALLFRYRP